MIQEIKLPKATLMVWQIRLLSAALLLDVLIYIIFASALPCIILFALMLVFSFLYLPKLKNSYLVELAENFISVKYGVITKSEIIMPLRALIFAESLCLPLSKAYGISAVVLKATKGFIFIPEIEKDLAEALLSLTAREHNG